MSVRSRGARISAWRRVQSKVATDEQPPVVGAIGTTHAGRPLGPVGSATIRTWGQSAEQYMRRFLNKLDTGCWEWTGARALDGYGSATYRHSPWKAHRLAYTLWVGPIPEDQELHHLCHNPPCCNPAHLQAVTRLEHTRLEHVAPTHCPQGHEYTIENTYRNPNNYSSPVCKTCRAAANRRYKQRLRAG